MEIEYLKKYLDPSKLEEGLKLLSKGIPVQYIVGHVDFYGLNFLVDERVLIPRFETEELVEKTIDYVSQYFNRPISILDIGTGSGCIAITLFKNLETTKVDALDISSKALEVAIQNNERNQALVHFFESDLFSRVEGKYDLIISNPPYIAYDEEIMDIVKNNEPNIALYASNDGLYFYEEILKCSKKYLNERSIIAFEIGESQGNKIKELAKKYFPKSKVVLHKDLQNRNRFIFIFN